MTTKQVVETLKEMDCEIAKVTFKFYYVNRMMTTDVLVYLVDQPSNTDQIINCKHWLILGSIDEFEEFEFKFYGKDDEFIDVTEFVSDFATAKDDKKIDPVQEEADDIKTIQWYKVKCSFFKQEFGVRKWSDLIEFMSHTIGFDYTITGQYTKPYTGVEGYYENGQIIKL